jgi:hypothetical protein
MPLNFRNTECLHDTVRVWLREPLPPYCYHPYNVGKSIVRFQNIVIEFLQDLLNELQNLLFYFLLLAEFQEQTYLQRPKF